MHLKLRISELFYDTIGEHAYNYITDLVILSLNSDRIR